MGSYQFTHVGMTDSHEEEERRGELWQYTGCGCIVCELRSNPNYSGYICHTQTSESDTHPTDASGPTATHRRRADDNGKQMRPGTRWPGRISQGYTHTR